MIILNILLFILTAFMYLLAFILFLVVVVLVSPIRYRLIVVKNSKLIVDFEGYWLFRLVSVSFKRYENKKNNFLIKFFGKTLGAKKKKKRKKTKTVKPDKIPNNTTQKPVSQSQNTVSEQKSETISKPSQTKEKPTKEKPIKKVKPIQYEETKSSKKDLVTKILKYPYKKLLISKTIVLLKRLIQALKPSKMSLQTVFGTGDPNTTGLILGSLYGALGMINYSVDAAGDFEKARFDLDLNVKGSFTFGRLLFIFFLYVISKPVWEIIRIYRGKSKLV